MKARKHESKKARYQESKKARKVRNQAISAQNSWSLGWVLEFLTYPGAQVEKAMERRYNVPRKDFNLTESF